MDHSPLNLASLCTGGGGLDLAVHLAIPDARTVVMVEREAYACEVLATAMENHVLAPAPVWSDVTTFDGKPWRGLLDGLFGGIPCQPWSEAGEQGGHDDERDLTADTLRIIDETGVWIVWIENVGGMLHKGGIERLHGELQRRGFAVEVGLFTASECGVNQERERCFVLAVADPDSLGSSVDLRERGDAREERPAPAGGGGPMGDAAGLRRGEGRAEHELRGRRGSPADAGGHVGGADGGERDGRPEEPRRGSEGRTAIGRPGPGRLSPPRPDDTAGWVEFLEEWPDLEPTVCKRADGLAYRIEQLRLLGNGVVPLEGAYALRYGAASLALRGSRGAARLVRMMGIEL